MDSAVLSMFYQGLSMGFLRINADNAYTKRVFDLYLKRHQDDLLGLGYHHYQQAGRGVLGLSCRYRDLFFGKGFYPTRSYQPVDVQTTQTLDVMDSIAAYNPEIEVIVQLTIQNSDLNCLSRISKNGLALSVIHRQYLNRLLDYRGCSDTVLS